MLYRRGVGVEGADGNVRVTAALLAENHPLVRGWVRGCLSFKNKSFFSPCFRRVVGRVSTRSDSYYTDGKYENSRNFVAIPMTEFLEYVH
jgi:hypothetical protein